MQDDEKHEMDDIFSPTPWPSEIPMCDPAMGFVGLPDEHYNSFLNKLARRKKRSLPFPSISSVDGLRGQPYLVTLVNGRLYDTSVACADLPASDGLEAGTPFTRPIMTSLDQIGIQQRRHSISAFGVCLQLGIQSTELIQILRRKEIALLEKGVSREKVVAAITEHAMRIKRHEIFLKWGKFAAKLKRREEIKASLAKAKTARSFALWQKLAERLQHRDGLVKVAASKKAERVRRKSLKLWRSAIRQVIADNASAKPIVALPTKGKKKVVLAEPETRVYAKKTSKKKTTPMPDAVDKAKRLSEKEKKLAVLAENVKTKADSLAADAAAREARAEARRLGREIGGGY